MKTVLGYLRPHAGRVAAGAAIKFTAAVLELILPLLLAEVIDELVPAGDTAAIWRTGGWMSLLALGAVGCNITANRMAAWVSMEMTRVLRQDLYRRIQGLSCTQADQFSPSSLVSRLTNDTYNVHQMFDKVQRGGIRAPMLVLGGLILTFLLEPSLALVQLAVSLLTFLTITLVTRRGIPHYTRAQAAVDTVVRILRENAAGVRVVKALACQVRERDRFDTANQAQRQAEAQAGQVMALANPITDLLLNAGLILVVLVGALRVNAGLMPPGQIVAFMTYFTLIQKRHTGAFQGVREGQQGRRIRPPDPGGPAGPGAAAANSSPACWRRFSGHGPRHILLSGCQAGCGGGVLPPAPRRDAGNPGAHRQRQEHTDRPAAAAV